MDLESLRERKQPQELSVSKLNSMIAAMFGSNPLLSSVSVRGEISNFKNHSSGHLYFTLKDEGSEIRAVMFRSAAASLRFRPEDGMKVIVRAQVSVYEKAGSYQLYVQSMRPDGIGDLYEKFEEIKRKLEAEGLFDPLIKRPLPRYPERIGVITSPTGAAVRDIIHVTGRRFPFAEIRVYPALVQGTGSVASLLQALDYFFETKSVDVLIIGRGGGSIEDLWSFNSEEVARKIRMMPMPVISAVGHETDFTICDFVADLRAPTPSAAAEMAVPDYREMLLSIDALSVRCRKATEHFISESESKLRLLSLRPCLSNGEALYRPQSETLRDLYTRLLKGMNDINGRNENKMTLLAEKLQALSPLSVLGRGYSVAETNGAVVRSVNGVRKGQNVSVRLPDGTLFTEVIGIETMSKEK